MLLTFYFTEKLLWRPIIDSMFVITSMYGDASAEELPDISDTDFDLDMPTPNMWH